MRFEDIKSITIGSARIEIEIADDLGEQLQGLSDRDSLCLDCGMLFIYKKPKIQRFTMRGMKFPLDMIFIREDRVVEIRENIPNPQPREAPVKIQSREKADMVLEVNAGFARLKEIKVGDIMVGDIMKLN